MKSGRTIVLIPSEQDRTDINYLTVYWPNFVETVRQLLAKHNIDARLVVASEVPGAVDGEVMP
jgi:hypothetical protein